MLNPQPLVPLEQHHRRGAMEIKGRGVGGLVLGVVLFLLVLGIAFLLSTANSVVPTVPDQTNDEMEVVPS